MPSIDQIAPNLSTLLTEPQAQALLEQPLAPPPPPTPLVTDVSELAEHDKDKLLIWLAWNGAKRIPGSIAGLREALELPFTPSVGQVKAFCRKSPRDICRMLRLHPGLLRTLFREMQAIRSEVTRGQDAFKPAAVTPVIDAVSLDVPAVGDVTITGRDFDSWEPKVTYVRIERPDVGQVTLSQTDIETAGGTVAAAKIILPSALIPGSGAKLGDLVTVRADGLDSVVYTVSEPEPEPEPEPDPEPEPEP